MGSLSGERWVHFKPEVAPAPLIGRNPVFYGNFGLVGRPLVKAFIPG